MRKRIACVTAAILSISLGVSGCGLIPFEQDIPFLSSIAENAETEKKTEQQTIDEQDADTEKSTEDTQQDDGCPPIAENVIELFLDKGEKLLHGLIGVTS